MSPKTQVKPLESRCCHLQAEIWVIPHALPVTGQLFSHGISGRSRNSYDSVMRRGSSLVKRGRKSVSYCISCMREHGLRLLPISISDRSITKSLHSIPPLQACSEFAAILNSHAITSLWKSAFAPPLPIPISSRLRNAGAAANMNLLFAKKPAGEIN